MFRLGLVLAVLLPAVAAAHTRSVSYSSWALGEVDAHVVVRVSLYDLTRLPWTPRLPRADHPHLDPALEPYLVDGITLRRGGRPCGPVAPAVVRSVREGVAVLEWTVRCDPDSGAAVLRSAFLLDAAPSHMHIASVTSAEGGTRERVLTEAEPEWPLSAGEPQGRRIAAYVGIGVAHIWTGYDHLAFLLALLLLVTTLKEIATLVTGFTLAHSLTLGLAVTGALTPHAAAVEALIGFSIALVAAENAWHRGGRGRAIPGIIGGALLVCGVAALLGYGVVPAVVSFGLAGFTLCYFGALARAGRPLRLRIAVSFAFGLVHGFGFAGVLAQAELPANRLVPALFGFNVGVELGQLVVVALLWPMLVALARVAEAPRRSVEQLGSAALCGLGVFWCVTRGLGG